MYCYVTIASPVKFPLSSLNAKRTQQRIPSESVTTKACPD